MSVAVVEQSRIDSYLERVQRFVDNVYSFKERLDAFLSDQPATELDNQPVYESASYEPAEEFSASEDYSAAEPVITAEDVDIDALLSDIDLSSDYAL